MTLISLLFLGLPSACTESDAWSEPEEAIDASFAGKADGVDFGPEAICAALRVANEATFEALDDNAGLDRRAASGIVAGRPLADLGELDAVPYVGPVALGRLVDYAASEGIACEEGDETLPLVRGRIVDTRQIHDEWRPVPLAYTFWAKEGIRYTARGNGPGTSNRPVFTVVGPLDSAAPVLSALATVVTFEPESDPGEFSVPESGVYALLLQEAEGRTGFVDFSLRPTAWELAPACDVEGLCDCSDDSDCGPGAVCEGLTFSRVPTPAGLPTGKCAPTFPDRYDAAACAEPGGVYRTVTFTPEEACEALDVLNHAQWSVLRDRSAGWHRVIFNEGPGEASRDRVSRWTSLAQVARQKVEFGSVGSATMRALKAIAAEGHDFSEPVSDTVQSTFVGRFESDGEEVFLEQVLVTAVDPGVPSCGTLRDEAGASHYLRFCADDLTPLAPVVDERIVLRGTLSFRDGKWTIDGWFWTRR